MVCKEEIELRHVKHSAFKDMILASAITFPREKVLSIFVFVKRKFNIIEIQSNEHQYIILRFLQIFIFTRKY